MLRKIHRTKKQKQKFASSKQSCKIYYTNLYNIPRLLNRDFFGHSWVPVKCTSVQQVVAFGRQGPL